MRSNLRLIAGDNLIRISLILSTILMIVQTALIVIFFPKLPPLIPFLNSRPWGETRLYPSQVVFIIPAVFVIIFLINNFLSALFYKKNTLASRILSFNCLLFIFIGIIAFVQITFMVF